MVKCVFYTPQEARRLGVLYYLRNHRFMFYMVILVFVNYISGIHYTTQNKVFKIISYLYIT